MRSKALKKVIKQAWQEHEQHHAMPYFKKTTVHLWVKSIIYGMQIRIK